MLHRLIFASDAVGSATRSTLSIAQILGVSDRNNRRDRLCSAVVFHEGGILQAVEGARADIDRLMGRLAKDGRHERIRILSDLPIPARFLAEPMAFCDPPADEIDSLLAGRSLTALQAEEAQSLLCRCITLRAAA